MLFFEICIGIAVCALVYWAALGCWDGEDRHDKW